MQVRKSSLHGGCSLSRIGFENQLCTTRHPITSRRIREDGLEFALFPFQWAWLFHSKDMRGILQGMNMRVFWGGGRGSGGDCRRRRSGGWDATGFSTLSGEQPIHATNPEAPDQAILDHG